MRKISSLMQTVNDSCEKATSQSVSVASALSEMKEKADSRVETYKNLDTVFDDINKEFCKKTSILNKKDQTFLWTAVALQLIRWMFLTSFIEERPNDQEAAKEVKGNKKEEHIERVHKLYNPSLQEIEMNPVPFDTTFGAPFVDSDIAKHGGHRYTVLGHDPVLGWIFGTANIMTSTLTDYKFHSFHVKTGADARNREKDKLVLHADTAKVISYSKKMMFDEGLEGKKKFIASIIKEFIHLKSDVKTVDSLPFPAISVLASPELAAKLVDFGFDQENINTVVKQFTYANVINVVIRIIHGFLYDESRDISLDLYKVRTSKILSVSSLIAESLNIAYVGSVVTVGVVSNEKNTIKHGLCKMDIGGYIEAVHQIVSSSVLQEKIRREFLEQKLYEKLVGDDYSFLKQKMEEFYE